MFENHLQESSPCTSDFLRIHDIGAVPLADGTTHFRVWAPLADTVAVTLTCRESVPVQLAPEGNGYFKGTIDEVGHGDCYRYLLDGTGEYPDPASRCQPDGVHGPSQIVDPQGFSWTDEGWCGLHLEQYIIYELHVGTFTSQGTFDGVISRLDYLCELGITAVELMPVAQFPGTRNWGYDGTYPFAPQNSYGGADGMKGLVNACHGKGLAVILDVVYNHLGPEGNYLHAFGPYFTDRYRTPWGDAINFDGPDSDPVRHYFISNALYWLTEYHMDALRLDAVHGIFDFSARHILQELTEAVHGQAKMLGRQCYVMAESNLNDVRVITPPERGGYGLDAQWNDDFHHALRTFLTGDRHGYYADFGAFSDLVKAFCAGYVLDGVYSVFFKRRHGSSSAGYPPSQLVVFSQNHDQVGNRMRGERLHEHLSCEQLRLAAATVLLSPSIPLLFMGEEYIEPAPFPYFISHGDPELVEAVRQGRRSEFAQSQRAEEIPDPQAEATFLSAKIDPILQGDHASQFAFYRELIHLRKELTLSDRSDGKGSDICADEMRQLLTVRRCCRDGSLFCLFNFSNEFRSVDLPAPGRWRVVLESTASTPHVGQVVERSCMELAPFAVVVCRHRDSL